ncbi:hypothetical protein BJX66DRAFT_339600 [Aspergillus keveii]|uniref:Uncharacterized protein n=1 Tax=Aspergillus keveii TaxID=714993 RepID=A0ABR4G0X7_9EURO
MSRFSDDTLPPFPEPMAHIQGLGLDTYAIYSLEEEEAFVTGSIALYSFFTNELDTPVLDTLYPHLWCVGRRSGASIDPLHEQQVEGREITVSENPQMHLTWRHNRIYLKPVPPCLLSYEFWATYLRPAASLDPAASEDNRVRLGGRSLAMGFLRSYAFLIKHHSDFLLAQQFRLIPDDVKWIKWSQFIHHFRNIEDAKVARRSPVSTPERDNRVVYQIPYWSIEQYLQQAVTQLIFCFASISLVLSSMQVALAASEGCSGGGTAAFGWSISTSSMTRGFWVFSVIILLCSAAIWLLLIVIPLVAFAWQIYWGYMNRAQRQLSIED